MNGKEQFERGIEQWVDRTRTILDREGNPVAGMSKELLEDGLPQVIGQTGKGYSNPNHVATRGEREKGLSTIRCLGAIWTC